MDTLLLILITLGVIVYFRLKNKKTSAKPIVELFNLTSDTQAKDALLDGLIYKYNTQGRYTEFEYFIANLFKDKYGGEVKVTSKTGDFGVDFEHRINDNLVLGQVKCYEKDKKVSYEPIAIIHSNMIQRGALSGMVVTTSDFSSDALKYAEGLNIELVNGQKIIDIWTDSKTKKPEIKYTITDYFKEIPLIIKDMYQWLNQKMIGK